MITDAFVAVVVLVVVVVIQQSPSEPLREHRYFISSLKSITRIARSIRCHWNVENKLHWVMDVDFDEDSCRARKDHSAENFATLRQIAHNLLKKESSKNVSIRRKINKAGWNNDFLARVVAGL